jgi:hypothetical protein
MRAPLRGQWWTKRTGFALSAPGAQPGALGTLTRAQKNSDLRIGGQELSKAG